MGCHVDLLSTFYFSAGVGNCAWLLEPTAGGIGVDGAALLLDSCAEAIALGDGRELFSLQGDGQLLSVPGGLCASVGENDLAEGAAVSFAKCDGGSRWEIQGNGQLRLKSVGDFCLTQEGAAPGLRDVAANAAAMASSTGNAFSHGGFFYNWFQ